MSLRLRLLLSLLALAAVGLIVVDVVSYTSLRSHLSERVDQQVESARGPVTIALLGESGVLRERLAEARRDAIGAQADGPPRAGNPTGPRPQTFAVPGPQQEEAPAAGAPGPPGAGPPDVIQLPPGTYGLLRNQGGKQLGDVQFSYGERGLPTPRLPTAAPVSAGPGELRTFNVPAQGGGTEFRAAAYRFPGTAFTTFIAVPLDDFQDTLDHVALVGAIVTASVLLGLGLLAWWLIRLGLRPLEEIGETAGMIAAGDLGQRVEETNPKTEVGRLGVSLNAMLGQIEGAFAQREASEMRMRRFLADASHELRTPLTSIRGYAEVFRIGAAHHQADLDRAMRRIEQESARMGDMVDDLMALARLDEVREPRREPVDLAALVAEACDDARAAHPGREITLSAPNNLRLEGDPDQLRRVAGNLLANAVTHTPPGTSVEVDLNGEGEVAVLTVRDHGPGISADAAEKVFERFWRQSPSRGRDSGGAGLGLAIVAGVVEAHGGGVRAQTHPHGGALFTVELPLAVAAPG